MRPVPGASQLRSVAERLAQAGCVAPVEEAHELLSAAAGDPARLAALVERRCSGVPLAWVTGSILFGGVSVLVHEGVYEPRLQTEALVARAIELLPVRGGVAADLCTGSGAVAAALAAARPGARVVATDIDALACRCAAANGVEVYQGDLAAPLPAELQGNVDVVIAVVPYVPTEELPFLPRDVRHYEPEAALDGGPGGTRVLEQAVRAAAQLLRPGGAVLLEMGGDQDVALAPVLAAVGFGPARRVVDDDGDLRGIEANRWGPGPPVPVD
jgi:release factor glutamine methyltransferase